MTMTSQLFTSRGGKPLDRVRRALDRVRQPPAEKHPDTEPDRPPISAAATEVPKKIMDLAAVPDDKLTSGTREKKSSTSLTSSFVSGR